MTSDLSLEPSRNVDGELVNQSEVSQTREVASQLVGKERAWREGGEGEERREERGRRGGREKRKW